MIESKVKGGFMSNCIYTAPVYKLEELNNLFIELTAKTVIRDVPAAILIFL